MKEQAHSERRFPKEKPDWVNFSSNMGIWTPIAISILTFAEACNQGNQNDKGDMLKWAGITVALWVASGAATYTKDMYKILAESVGEDAKVQAKREQRKMKRIQRKENLAREQWVEKVHDFYNNSEPYTLESSTIVFEDTSEYTTAITLEDMIDQGHLVYYEYEPEEIPVFQQN